MQIKHTKEIWKWVIVYIKGKKISYEGYYKVSNFGRVKSVVSFIFRRTWECGNPIHSRIYKKQVWKGSVESKIRGGYLRVILRTKTFRKDFKIQHLVLWTFVGGCPEGMECCHKNDVKTDNRLENLYWGTSKQNSQDAIRNGKLVNNGKHNNHARGESHCRAKSSDEEISEIRELYSTGKFMQKELAQKFGLHYSAISLIVRNRRRVA